MGRDASRMLGALPSRTRQHDHLDVVAYDRGAIQRDPGAIPMGRDVVFVGIDVGHAGHR